MAWEACGAIEAWYQALIKMGWFYLGSLPTVVRVILPTRRAEYASDL